MGANDTITVLSYEQNIEIDSQKHMIPGIGGVRARVSEMKKSVLTESLSSLVADLHEVIQNLPSTKKQSELESISVAIQISAQGSAAMIISASTEVSNAITLTFKLKKQRQKRKNNG